MKDRAGRFVAANRQLAGHFGLEPRQLVGRTDSEILGEDRARQSRTEDERVMNTEKMLRVERTVDRDGQTRWMETIKVPVYDADNHVVGICGLSRDITQRKQAEATLREMNHLLELRADELAAANRELDAYTYTVSHDLHAPLRHISGFTRLLKDRLGDRPDARAQRLFDHITAATERMSQLIDDLLEFSRTNRAQLSKERVPLDALLAEVVEEVSAGLPQRQIEWRIGPLPVVHGDRNLLRVAFFNLIANAVKYTRKRADPFVEIGSTVQTADEAIVYVRDNGVGFDMHEAQRLFGVFERLHDGREFEGSGIGLAIVKRVVERHGGRVWAQGQRGAGATFYLALPKDAGGEP